MTFQVGEKIVYPNHGVATVENISSRPFAGQPERFYLLRLNATSLTVMVPCSHADELRLRKVTRNGAMARVIDFLGEPRRARQQDWKDRFKENTEKMNSGSLLEIAEVLKSLTMLQMNKPLSFREKKMLDRARHMLVTELSTSRGWPEAQAIGCLEQVLSKANLRLPEPM
ncbi:MAG: CarD family transcriptional regulator [Bryobacteraceae bacterium]